MAPTVLGSLGVEPQQPMEGQDLTQILENKNPEERPHFTLGYDDYVWSRDESYVLMCRNDGSGAKLYDMQKDPDQNNNIASANPGIVNKMFNEYVLKDAGGPLPKY